MTSKADSLMGDLETIKALLEEDEQSSLADAPVFGRDALAEPPERPPIPEVSLEPAAAAPESQPLVTPRNESVLHTSDEQPPISDLDAPILLDALLGDEFQTATANVMARARSLIEAHPTEWSPQQTDELSEALRVRIDDAVRQWITSALAAHSSELQHKLLDTVHQELARHLEAFESNTED